MFPVPHLLHLVRQGVDLVELPLPAVLSRDLEDGEIGQVIRPKTAFGKDGGGARRYRPYSFLSF